MIFHTDRLLPRLAGFLLLLALPHLALAAEAPAPMRTLRAFGKIVETRSQVGESGLDLTVFTCQDADKAWLLMHKMGRDLAQSATVPALWEQVRVGETEARALVRPGIGAILPAVAGAEVLVFTSSKTRELGVVFAAAAGRLKGARFFDPAYRYPVFYDKFSANGIGSWYPTYWADNNTEGKPNSVDDHFAYARKLDLSIQPNAGDFLLRNILPKLREYGRPYHFAQWQEWSQDLARMAPEELVVPGDKFNTRPHYYGQVSDGGRKILEYRNWCFQNTTKEQVKNPLLVDWLDPNGEVGPMPFYYYWDFSEGNRQNLVRYLKDQRKYTLESLGTAWYGDGAKFKSWDNVAIPMDYDFFGYRAGGVDILADKSWRIHPSTTSGVKAVDSGVDWRTMVNDCPPYIRDGIARGFTRVDFNDQGWAEMNRPGGELASTYWTALNGQFVWRRGAIEVGSAWLENARKSGKVYLTLATLNESRGWKIPDRFWFNGAETASVSTCPGSYIITQIDVTDTVKAGRNQIVQLANITAMASDGPCFLTTRKMENYPFGDSQLNARYYDWYDYIAWGITEKMEETYKAIRAVDPDRPIKMHAALYKDQTIPLAAKYGCYPHNTGEGGFFRPWDKHSGFVYGLQSSAEFGGGIVEPNGWKRWLGWYTFEGNNAFDNFHNIQEMMYSPVKDLWVQYMPYLKLANRREFKKPGIALFYSSQNDRMLARPVPLCFDLGRGDLQFIGQSSVYVDEAGVKNGVLKDYPVVWDLGTWMMDEATVAGIKKYVEAGGTYVAMTETGRHTFTKRDAWPISDLTGFAVTEVRPMTGTISILVDQPLFKKLAGRNFYNRGKSIDYSDYNYADKCCALKAIAPDTIPLARYDDGTIAIGMRKLGKGRVIVLGSPFWRDSYDGNGMWWPGESQCAFLEDILDGVGVKPVATADTHDVWREHYLANNGTEEYLALFNPFDTPRTFSVQWNTNHPVAGLFDPKNGQPIKGVIDGTSVKLEKITLAGLETLIVAAQSVQAPKAALDDWFTQLALCWQPSAGGTNLVRPDLPTFTMQLGTTMKGKVVAAADLPGLEVAGLSKQADPGAGFALWAGQSYEELRSKPDPERRVVLHCPVTLPEKWSSKDQIELVVSTCGYTGVENIVDAYINGTKVITQGKTNARGYNELEDGVVVDINKVVDFKGSNAICVVAGSNGFVGEVKLRRRPAVAETLEVTGQFKVQRDADGGVGTAAVPGVVKGLYAWKDDVMIPASWKGSRVFMEIEVANLAEYNAFAINEKVIFHPVGEYKPVTWMDVTPWVKFGQNNKLTLLSQKMVKEWLPGAPEYKSIRIQRVEAGGL